MIDVAHLTYTYPRVTQPALRDVSLHIGRGEFVLITGSSGSGKSTLLRCFNGLTPHFSGGTIAGSVTVNGVDIIADATSGMGRTVGFVFQTPEAQAILDTVEPEIAFVLENAAIPPVEMEARVTTLLDQLALTPLRNRPLRTLSGGERQRVAVASALALQPPILVLDEPTSQLDPHSAESLLQTLVRLNQEAGLTVILAEHRLDRVLPYIDRMIVLEDGMISADGAPRDVIRHSPLRPPLVEIAVALGWEPLPLSIADGRHFAATISDAFVPPVRTPPKHDTPVLRVEEVTVAYGANTVVNGVDMIVAPGEIVGLLGRNGSGKSTLLKSIVGLLPLIAGAVWVADRPIAGRSVASICQEVGYLPQNPDDLLFADTVLDELSVTLRNHGLLHKPPIDPYQLINELGLRDVAHAYPRDLSVGQRQRVALASILVTQPRLLLLDEPTRGLDAPAKHDLALLLRQLQAQGMGIVLVTHDVELAAQLADRVLILDGGRVIAAGDSAEILTSSPDFAPQMAQLFPDQQWHTVAAVLHALGRSDTTSIK